MATQVEILMRTEGGPAAASAAGGAPSGADKEAAEKEKKAEERSKKEQTTVGKMSKTFNDKMGGAKNFFKKNLGLQFTSSSMLKQSQVFTSFVGTIFQLMGALVDVMLAPLLPLFFPLVRMLASAIPHFQKKGEWLGAKLLGFFEGIRNWYTSTSGFLKEKWSEFKTAWDEGLGAVVDLFIAWGWEALKWYWEKLKARVLWVWEKIKGIGTWAWEKFKEWGNQTKQRVIAFALYTYNKIVERIKAFRAWLKTLGPEARELLKTQIKNIVKGILKSPFKIFGYMLKFLGHATKAFLPGIGHIIVGVGKIAGTIITGIGKGLWVIIKFLWKQAFRLVKFMLTGAVSRGKNLLGTLLKKVTTSLSGMKFFGGAFKKLGNALGFLKVAAKASKAIPVLGAVATVGFGIAETVKNTKKYGWKAGLATAGKTATAATLAGLGQTYASLAVDMGGSLAIDQMGKRGVFGKEGAHFQKGGAGYQEPTAVNIKIVTNTEETLEEGLVRKQVGIEQYESDLSARLSASGGAPT